MPVWVIVFISVFCGALAHEVLNEYKKRAEQKENKELENGLEMYTFKNKTNTKLDEINIEMSFLRESIKKELDGIKKAIGYEQIPDFFCLQQAGLGWKLTPKSERQMRAEAYGAHTRFDAIEAKLKIKGGSK